MYCKFCGAKLKNINVCPACGTKIDPNDCGQTFFDDDELSEWKEESTAFNIKTIMPEIRIEMNTLPQKGTAERKQLSLSSESQASHSDYGGSMPERSSLSAAPRKPSKTRARTDRQKSRGIFELSKSNKIIAMCIACTLALVMIVVGIIALISGNGSDDSKETPTEGVFMSSVGVETASDTGGAAAPISAATGATY